MFNNIRQSLLDQDDQTNYKNMHLSAYDGGSDVEDSDGIIDASEFEEKRKEFKAKLMKSLLWRTLNFTAIVFVIYLICVIGNPYKVKEVTDPAPATTATK